MSCWAYSATVALIVSIVGNVEQYNEWTLRMSQIDDLKLDKEMLKGSYHEKEEQLKQMRDDFHKLQKKTEQQTVDMQKFASERDILVVLRDQEQAHIADLKRQLSEDKSLSEKQRAKKELELNNANMELAKKAGEIEAKDRVYNELRNDYDSTQAHMKELSNGKCGSFTPTGMRKMTDEWVGLAPIATSIFAYFMTSVVLGVASRALIWQFDFVASRVWGDPRRVALAVQGGEAGGGAAALALQGCGNENRFAAFGFVWWISKIVACICGFTALIYLPIYMDGVAGQLGGHVANRARDACYQQAPFQWMADGCNTLFDTTLTPLAVITARGEAYKHLAFNSRHLFIAQFAALAGEVFVLSAIRTGRGALALAFGSRRYAQPIDMPLQPPIEKNVPLQE